MRRREGEATRRTFRRIGQTVATLAALVLLGGCSSGQTGQPESPSERCETPNQTPSFVRAFEGRYSAPLVWEGRMVDGGGETTVRDELVVSISLDPTPHVSSGCIGTWITVEVEVEVATRDLGTLEHGKGLLTFNGDAQHGQLTSIGNVVNISATLTHAESTSISGALDAIQNNLPGEHAVFPAP